MFKNEDCQLEGTYIFPLNSRMLLLKEKLFDLEKFCLELSIFLSCIPEVFGHLMMLKKR